MVAGPVRRAATCRSAPAPGGASLMAEWFGASWSTIAWVAATTTAMYATTIITVRLAGRRTLTQLSAFDIVVTIALGSVIATTAVQRNASYVQGTTAVFTLLSLQTLLAAVRQRFPRVAGLIDFKPEPVVQDGEFTLRANPLGPQLTRSEVLSRMREKGVFTADGVHLVLIEPGGGVSILEEPHDGHDLPGRTDH